MRRLKTIIGVALFFVVWEAIALSGLAPRDYFPTVQTIGRALLRMAGTTRFWSNVAATCLRLVSGFAIAIALGLALAFLAAKFRVFRQMLEPMVEILRVLPPPALAPIAIYALGLGPRMFLFIIVNAALWPIYLSATNALMNVEPLQLLSGRAYGYSPLEIVFVVQFPAALPEILTGVRVAAGFALLATIAAEMLAGTNGIGYQLYDAGFSLRTAQMFALMFTIGLLGVCIQAMLGLSRRFLISWHTALAGTGREA